MRGRRGFAVARTIVLSILSVVIIVPLIILFASSLKGTRQEILADAGSFKAFFAPDPTLQNFIDILGPKAMSPFLRYMLNSGIVLVATVALTVLVSSMAAFVLLRGRFQGRKVLLMAITALYIIPTETIMLPMLFECISLRLTDTYWVQILPFIASPLFIFLFYQFFGQVPQSIAEAALIDGAGPFAIYRQIYLPLNGPSLATVAILQGMSMWNQYLWPLLSTNTDDYRPITVAIASFFGSDTILWNLAMAGSVMMMIPVLLFFLFFQRFFIESVTSTAVKG
jgi:ABC-type sugar transport system, permease component